MDKFDRQARSESSIYRQGPGWTISLRDEATGYSELTDNLPWPRARQALADWRQARAQQLRDREAASAFGRLGGSARTAAKAVAVRENGLKGGRPKKVDPTA